MPKNDLIVREPSLPSVPLPPSMVKDEPVPIKEVKLIKIKVAKRSPEEINAEYINSEFSKIDFYLDGGQIEPAEKAYKDLRKVINKEQKQIHKYDFQRILTSLELLRLK